MNDPINAPVTHHEWSSGGAFLRQWLGLLGAPVAWFAQFQASYSIVTDVCHSRSTLALHLLSLGALLLTVGALLLAMRTRRTARQLPRGEFTGGPVGRSWLMGTVGMLIGIFFIFVIVAQWIATMMIDPCWH
jgi:uncharacterized membrane protein YidH (DUF202 family)